MTSEQDSTIAALSTPAGESGIAVVRVSGGRALAILTGLFRTKDGAERSGDWEHRRLYHGWVVDAEGEPIDEVVCAVMRGPESYTGDDTVEIRCHGNTVIVSRLLRATFDSGARPAEPGEFTKRAFLNGKLDLIQAEAVADLIHARSELQQRVAREQLDGSLSTRIGTLADELLGLLGIIEANIDFIDEGIETVDYGEALALVRAHRGQLDTLLGSASLSRPFYEGYRVGIAGPVNAGKACGESVSKPFSLGSIINGIVRNTESNKFTHKICIGSNGRRVAKRGTNGASSIAPITSNACPPLVGRV